jgi:hypothetical protein
MTQSAPPPPAESDTAFDPALSAHGAIAHADARAITGRHLKYYDLVMAAFVAVLLLSNIIGAAKLASVGGVAFGAGILFFPISYVIGDVLTEVYGYARARRVIWMGFGALLFLAFMSWAVVAMPPDPNWSCNAVDQLRLADGAAQQTGAICQLTYEAVFGGTWRIVIASVLAFWAGEFVNSYVLARMKVWTRGRWLWTRTIGSTVFGQGIDSMIFYPIAFWGIWSPAQVLTVMVTNWAMKVAWEAALTPVTYVAVNKLKAAEGLDIYDETTDFSPFKAKV